MGEKNNKRMPGDITAIANVASIYLKAYSDKNDYGLLPDIINELYEWAGEKPTLAFLHSKTIQSIKNKPKQIQRVFINKYFRDLLLVHRGLTPDTNITDIYPFLVDENDIEEWLYLMKSDVIPFFKIERIFDRLYKNNNKD